MPLPPLSSEELEQLVRARADRAGIALDFSHLKVIGPFGSDPAHEGEQSVAAYFRLLAEASAGNPSVAVRMWHQCLSDGEHPDEARVHMHSCLAGSLLSGITEDELFVLMALRIQDLLTIDEIVSVTNLPRQRIRSTLQRLRHQDLLYETGGRIGVTSARTPAVTHTLRRRHFLQWEV